MNVKAFLVVVLFIVSSALAGVSIACGSCAGSSACSSNGDGNECACADPACNSGNSCLSGSRCCEAFGNISETPTPNFDVKYSADIGDDTYADYRGADQAFNQQAYNTDAPRPRYK